LIDSYFDLLTDNPMWMYILIPISILFFISMSISDYIHKPDQSNKYVGGILAPLYLAIFITVMVLFYQTNS